MHLKSYPKLVRSELLLDAAGVQASSQRSGVFVSQQGALLKPCGGNHGNISSSSRLPFSVISTNTLRCSNTTTTTTTTTTTGGVVASLQLKAPPGTALRLLPAPPGCENEALRLYQTVPEDAEAPLDIWTVIKPGHVREKIAIFASEGGRADGAGGAERSPSGGAGSRDRAAAACTNHGGVPGPTRAVKAKGSWDENCSAKRRRRSGGNQNLQQNQRSWVLEAQKHSHKPAPQSFDPPPAPGGRSGGEEEEEEEEVEQKVSVVEMVAFLEQRASEQQLDGKPLLALQRSSTTITLSRAPPPEVREGSEVRGEEPESVRVSDMVAKLESECLRRRAEGDLSRSNSLRRAVGRVLLTAPDQSSAPSSPLGAQSPSGEPISCSEPVGTETPAPARTTPASPGLATPPSPHSGEEAGGLDPEAPCVAPPPQPEEAEPVPGLLFMSSPPAASTHPPTELRPPRYRTTFDLEPTPSQPRPSTGSGVQSDNRRRSQAAGGAEGEAGGAAPGRRASASQDFLEMRLRLQQLLEPQPYLAVLPHHLLVKIFLLLPTQSLAALKCTCHYFRFVIENYSVRPADSLWVSDPRYRDDPCKQCKRRYGRGDVSLCRWHHKPYCQALPYGPGYWMCCHGTRRDAPGCNVGLHDNRWVPAFHTINVPIYRRTHDDK